MDNDLLALLVIFGFIGAFIIFILVMNSRYNKQEEIKKGPWKEVWVASCRTGIYSTSQEEAVKTLARRFDGKGGVYQRKIRQKDWDEMKEEETNERN